MSDDQEIVVTGWASALPSPPQSTASTLVSLAIQQGANIETLERLYNLQREYEKDEARKAFAVAMAKFKAEQIVIDKDKLVDHRGGTYRHATLGNVVAIVSEALGRHGLYHAWAVKQDEGIVHVKCTLTHQLGHSESVAMWGPPDNSGSKNLIQQIASTVTYLQRYTLMSITGVAASEQDDDGAGSETPAQVLAFRNEIRLADTLPVLSEIRDRIKSSSLTPAQQQTVIGDYQARAKDLSAKAAV